MRFVLLLLVFIISMSCNNQSKESANKIVSKGMNLKEESFDDFFHSFSRDSVFQNSRIKFPLLVIIDDIDEKEQKLITQKDWGFFGIAKLSKPKYIQTVEKINSQEYHLTIQMEDTGVYVVYVFKREKNSWMLTQMIDSST
ncbi:DUF4348 domain-containing protein [Emticicia sp. TH156]|uniref:DUF4348 domain-containing protein n=1 Tax=Emticicia sp. TH156 TaxID=2067454 RepID=UPI000C78C9CC|nr:DUF4348 domain-containing protein [Emticicia sp. TH156]PLK44822.1 hypothetical protein C0V77_10305 [Emticicia sp. TH156]